jgi:hypothetical protein
MSPTKDTAATVGFTSNPLLLQEDLIETKSITYSQIAL